MKTHFHTKTRLFGFFLLIFFFAGCSNDDEIKGPPTDGDGNTYTSVTIGDQEWLVENLKTTKLNDGTTIPEVADNGDWNGLQSPGMSWYDNDESQYNEAYGALYNWYVVETGKVCPKGWHVASAEEWQSLFDFLGDSPASQLKEKGNSHWSLQNDDATNSTGFTARPGGYRSAANGFRDLGVYGYWWSSSFDPNNSNRKFGREMNAFSIDGSEVVYTGNFGMSIRCIKD